MVKINLSDSYAVFLGSTLSSTRSLLSVKEANVISDHAPVFALHPVLLPFVTLEATAYKHARPSSKIAFASLGGGAPDFDPVPLGLSLVTLADRGRDREDAKFFTRCGPLKLWILAKATEQDYIINQEIPL